MSHVSGPPFIVSDRGKNPRIRFTVSTPGALVFIDSNSPDSFVVASRGHAGANIAIDVARAYARKWRDRVEPLYEELGATVD